ncbi:unnamed protein product [Symbiodinium natans]|uniref:Uncharacterized protein n=1 Tax=Symbiodinium natans TaxID=878477 RepID=A0A812PRC5_9DINO|nr:unnamed protein product [Symbiodinium natans]
MQINILRWIRSRQADPAHADAPLAEQAHYLLQNGSWLQKLRGLPSEVKAWLLERAARGACLSDVWLTDWVELADKLIARCGSQNDRLSWEPLGAVAAVRLAARSVLVGAEELESLAWTIELLKPRRQATEFMKSVVNALDDGDEEADDPGDELSGAFAGAFQDVLQGLTHLGRILQLESTPWALQPKDCFDAVLFLKLLARSRGGGLRSLARRRDRGRRGTGLSLAATKASRLARLLTNVTPLMDDSESERLEKLSILKEREEEIVNESVPEDNIQDAKHPTLTVWNPS